RRSDGHAARVRRATGRIGRGAKRVDGGDRVVGQSACRGGRSAHRGREIIPIVGGRATAPAGGGLVSEVRQPDVHHVRQRLQLVEDPVRERLIDVDGGERVGATVLRGAAGLMVARNV